MFGKKYYTDLTPREFKEKMQEDNVVILDVRTLPEVREIAIPGHIHLDINQPQFPFKVMELDKSKTYLVYCRSGARSAAAANYMGQNGFSEVYNLQGGIIAWYHTYPEEIVTG